MRDHDDMHREGTIELEASGTETVGRWVSPISTAEDYALYAARAMNAASAPDTEFIADGATVTAYVHGGAHYSATFTLDTNRGYPYPEEYGEHMDSTGHLVMPA